METKLLKTKSGKIDVSFVQDSRNLKDRFPTLSQILVPVAYWHVFATAVCRMRFEFLTLSVHKF